MPARQPFTLLTVQPGRGPDAGMGEPAFGDLHPAAAGEHVNLATVPNVRVGPGLLAGGRGGG